MELMRPGSGEGLARARSSSGLPDAGGWRSPGWWSPASGRRRRRGRVHAARGRAGVDQPGGPAAGLRAPPPGGADRVVRAGRRQARAPRGRDQRGRRRRSRRWRRPTCRWPRCARSSRPSSARRGAMAAPARSAEQADWRRWRPARTASAGGAVRSRNACSHARNARSHCRTVSIRPNRLFRPDPALACAPMFHRRQGIGQECSSAQSICDRPGDAGRVRPRADPRGRALS